MGFLGYFLFVIFGGAGLAGLPIGMIVDFKNRPKLRSSSDGRLKKESLAR
jgi:hypothetical protein